MNRKGSEEVMRKCLGSGLAALMLFAAMPDSAMAKTRNRSRMRMMPTTSYSQVTTQPVASSRQLTPTSAALVTPVSAAVDTNDQPAAAGEKATISDRTVTQTAETVTPAAAVSATAPSQNVSRTEGELSGWALAADREARSGGPTTHAYSAGQLAAIAGHPGASVFVGVGMNGMTCRPGYGSLVAETTVNGKTVRIWLR